VIMPRATIIWFILIILASSSMGQVREKIEFLEVKRDGKFARYRFIAPAALNDAFPGGKASASSRVRVAISRRELWGSILRKVELYRLSRYVDYKSPNVTPESGAGSAYSHPTFFPAAIVGDEIYVFSRQDLPGSTNAFNRMIEKIGVKITSKDEARQLVELYMLFYSSNFSDPSKLIISRVGDIPQDSRAKRQEEAEKLAPLIHPLRATDLRGHYKVEFFTWEYLPRGEVINWQVNVFPNGRLEVSNGIAGMI
jgi:hypothetical protein